MDYRYNLIYKRLLEAETKGVSKPQAVSILQTVMGLILASSYTGKGLYDDATIKGISDMITGAKDFADYVAKMKSLLEKVSGVDSNVASKKDEYLKTIEKAASESEGSFKDSKAFEDLKKQLTEIFALSASALKKKAENLAQLNAVTSEIKESMMPLNEKKVSPAEAQKLWLGADGRLRSVDVKVEAFKINYPQHKADSTLAGYEQEMDQIRKDLDAISLEKEGSFFSETEDVKQQKASRKKYAGKIGKIENRIYELERKIDSLISKLTRSTSVPVVPPPTKTGGDGSGKTGGDGSGKTGGSDPSGNFDIKALQEHMASLADCIKNAIGKIDGKWGPRTAKATYVLYNLKAGKNLGTNTPLSKEIYDTVMSIDAAWMNSPALILPSETNESIAFKKKLTALLEKKESRKKLTVLKWNDFDRVFEEATSKDIDKLFEAAPAKTMTDIICARLATGGGGGGQTGGTGGTGGTGETGGTGGTGPAPDPEDILKDWEGFKPMEGALAIPFDESDSSFWTKAIGYTVAGAAIAGVIVFAGPAALGAMGALGTTASVTAASSTATLTGLSAAFTAPAGIGAVGLAHTGAVAGVSSFGGAPLAYLVFGAGAGSGIAAKIYSEDRVVVTPIIRSGYITKKGCVAIARGLLDTLDGAVYSKDMIAIQLALIAVKGAWTINKGKAVSAWNFVNKYYEKISNGERLFAEVDGIGTVTVKKMPFPDFENPAEEPDITDPADAQEAIEEAILALEANEKKMKSNLDKLNKLGEAGLKKLTDDITAASQAAAPESGDEAGESKAETD